MASVKIYLDTRTPKKDGTCPLKVSVSFKRKRFFVSLDCSVLPEQYDSTGGRNGITWIKEHRNKSFLNSMIRQSLDDVEKAVLRLQTERGVDKWTPKQLHARTREYIALSGDNGERVTMLMETLKRFMETKTGRTKEIYNTTLIKLQRYCPDDVAMAAINKDWLTRFESHERETTGTNSVSIHLRNIRAVFNYALDNELIENYPFRKFKIKHEATAKRSFSPEQFTRFLKQPCTPDLERWRKFWLLEFCLIGINTVDLYHLKKSDVDQGRAVFHRAKTHKLYSIKLEPEALAIIKDIEGETYLVNAAERYAKHVDFGIRLNRAIGKICDQIGNGFPNISTYWARHTWATFAHRLKIPKDTISMALGHSFGNRVTDIYIDYNAEDIDKANRKVLNYAFKLLR